MKKFKFLAVILVVVMAVGLFGACSGGNSGGSGNASSGGPEFVLKFANYNPLNTPIGEYEAIAFAYIEEQSNGRIKIEPYYNGTLLDVMDTWSGTGDGLADISYLYITVISGVQPVGEIFSQYFSYPAPNTMDTLKAHRKVLEDIPEIQAEAARGNMIILDVFGPNGGPLAMTRDIDIKVPEDLRGLTITANGIYIDILPQVGAAGVSLPPSDWYTSLERGVIDALCMNWNGIRAFGIEDLATHYIVYGDKLGLTGGGAEYLMNLDTWNSLPEDLQKIVVDGIHIASDMLAEYEYNEQFEVIDAVVANGAVLHYIDEKDMQPWYDFAAKANELWVQSISGLGYDGQAIWDTYLYHMTNY